MTKLIIEYVDDIDEIRVDERFELFAQVDKVAKQSEYKLFLEKSGNIFVSVYTPHNNVAIQNRVGLRISANDDIVSVVREFISERFSETVSCKVFLN